MEDCPAIYEMVNQIQCDLVPALLEEYPDELVQDENGDVSLTFDSPKELEVALEQCGSAFKRVFDAEEHLCEICMRRLLGDKFTFLSSCEHFFCTECITELIVSKINLGQI